MSVTNSKEWKWLPGMRYTVKYGVDDSRVLSSWCCAETSPHSTWEITDMELLHAIGEPDLDDFATQGVSVFGIL